MRTILVIGYARSGTSLTAGILHHLGVDMGASNKWRPADEANENGYFENKDFVRANQAILEKNTIPNLAKITGRNQDELWGAKDPRFLYTWNYWQEYMINPSFVLCRRDYKSITQSVCYRDDGRYSPAKDYSEVMEDVKEYYRKADRFLRGKPSVRVTFEDYFKSDAQVRKLADFVDLPFKPYDFVNDNLKHF